MSVSRTPTCVVRLNSADYAGPVMSARPAEPRRCPQPGAGSRTARGHSGADERAEPSLARRVRSVEVVAHHLGSPGVSRTARRTVR